VLREFGLVLYRDLQGLLKWPLGFTFLVGPILSFLLFAPSLGRAVGTIRVGAVEMSYAAFVVPGLLVTNSMILGQRACFSVWMDKVTGQLEVLFALPLRRATLVASGAAKAIFDVVLVNSALMLISVPLLAGQVTWSLRAVLQVWGVSVLSATAWALLSIGASAIIERSESFNLFINLLITPLMFTSSVYYPLAAIPDWIRPLAYVNPLTYAVNLLRGLLSGARGWLGVDLAVLLIFLAFSGAFAAALYPRSVK